MIINNALMILQTVHIGTPSFFLPISVEIVKTSICITGLQIGRNILEMSSDRNVEHCLKVF